MTKKRVNLQIEDDIEVMINNNLTPNDLFVIKLIFLAQEDNSQYLGNFFNNGGMDFREQLVILQEKGLILKSFVIPEKGKGLNFNRIPLNKNFLNRYMKCSKELGKELWDNYPDSMYINGKIVSIKNFARQGGFTSHDEFFFFYAKTINHNPKTHEEVMDALKYAVENNMVDFSIFNFVAEQKWEFITKIRDGSDINGYKNSELI